jgi:hypothetical protein
MSSGGTWGCWLLLQEQHIAQAVARKHILMSQQLVGAQQLEQELASMLVASILSPACMHRRSYIIIIIIIMLPIKP